MTTSDTSKTFSFPVIQIILLIAIGASIPILLSFFPPNAFFGGLLVLALGCLLGAKLPFQAQRVEDPTRLREFAKGLDALNWKETPKSLQEVYNRLDKLATAELQDHYNFRVTSRAQSAVMRFCGFLFVTIGTLIPLVVATGTSYQNGVTPNASWGYVALAIGAAFFAANRLFGGTSGHIRFVTTQLRIEQLITSSRLLWLEYIARAEQSVAMSGSPDTPTAKAIIDRVFLIEGFQLIEEYASELYNAMLNETSIWGDEQLAALKEMIDRIEHQKR